MSHRGACKRRVATIFVTLLLLSVSLSSFFIGSVAAQPNLTGHYFDYSFTRTVTNGGGEYEEYYDKTESRGHYAITDQNATHATFSAVYSWTYRSNEGDRQQGHEDRTVQFLLSTRHYVTQTDLDEWDGEVASTLAAWFWIPTNVTVGQQVKILDELYTVTSLYATVWSNWAPKKGIELVAEGPSSRNDEYGTFSFKWTDKYYFDRTTGFIIAERYSEHDIGLWQGRSASFDMYEDFDVTASSYEIPIDYLSLIIFWTLVFYIIAALVYTAYWARWRKRTISGSRYVGSTTTVHRIKHMVRFPSHLENVATDYFGPFLQDFANKGLLAKDVVAFAATDTELAGVAVYNREAKIGTILCKNSGITETLRKFVGAKDFFTETRHEMPEALRKEAASEGIKIRSPYTYNVFETYQVLEAGLESGALHTYDTTLISRMKEKDLPEVEELARKVYKVRSGRWLRAQLRSGDFGFVARLDGRVVGFAFATCVGDQGRLHTVTVIQGHRNEGIGKELLRARLHMLRNLGVKRVIAEVADWNMPSLHLLWSHGFRSIGTMQVETARTTRIKKNIVRR